MRNFAKNGAKLLTPEEKESRMNICADILNNIAIDPGLLDTYLLMMPTLTKLRPLIQWRRVELNMLVFFVRRHGTRTIIQGAVTRPNLMVVQPTRGVN
ncbi:hypothetical protein NQ318_008875 [Aromia moschata]|uniref:Uncharacterized protein n=1 Tax=Aromia moschata TaxID=1265417 RepID=A0AAV8ZC70_9CUCU|nr:hypothetical protein NQ318_008875 [Aromia moschata]